MKNKNEISIRIIAASILFMLATARYAAPQEKPEEYLSHYTSGNYVRALEIITRQLEDFYITRVEDKRIPTGFITIKDASREIDLAMLFRNRKAEPFFIEDNPTVSALHLYAARCYFNLSKENRSLTYYKTSNYDYSLNHYIQALRYKKVEEKKDDIIYYEISQIFKIGNYFNAYINYLEAASSLNMDNFSYSLELGKALYRTGMKKRAIYHLERYINGTDESISPELYLMLGNLYEDIGKYLETEKYYLRYLEQKPDDGHIQFALGHIAYYRTGNYHLALRCLDLALALLPKKEIYKISKAYEYKADIALQELEFENAVKFYSETIAYQDAVAASVNDKKTEIADLSLKIRDLKSSLLRDQTFEQYEEYENFMDKRGRLETELRQIENEYNKLNAGKVRWNIAYSLERMEKLTEAIKYYRDAIAFDYNPNRARQKIINLELKIKRGY